MSGRLAAARRIVVKIGSSTLVDAATGTLRDGWFAALCSDVARLRSRGQDVLIVSSGAIALGRRALGLPHGALKLEESQAAASVGQIRLARAYEEGLAPHRLAAAQVLLTLGDTEERRRYLNARATLATLLALGAVPVINENDAVATAEIRYGDNDRLAARVAAMTSADALVLLSDVDGLYTANPARDSAARHLAEVPAITPQIAAMAEGAGSALGKGGMTTKLEAARIATASGCAVAVALGAADAPLAAIEAGARCTWFTPASNPVAARKAWIGGQLVPKGRLTVDAGAAQALRGGKSLLPAGVASVEGAFERGDPVLVADVDGREIARGLVAYDASDAGRILGRRSADIEAILGYRGREEMIHRDDLVITA